MQVIFSLSASGLFRIWIFFVEDVIRSVPFCNSYLMPHIMFSFHVLTSYSSFYPFPFSFSFLSPLTSISFNFHFFLTSLFPYYHFSFSLFSITYRESGASTATVLTEAQKTDPTWIVEKWVLLWANQLRRWRLGLVIARLEEGHIGELLSGRFT